MATDIRLKNPNVNGGVAVELNGAKIGWGMKVNNNNEPVEGSYDIAETDMVGIESPVLKITGYIDADTPGTANQIKQRLLVDFARMRSGDTTIGATFGGNTLATTVNDATFTDVDVSFTATDGSKLTLNQYIKIDSEVLKVTNIATHVITVTRGCANTTATAHATGSRIFHCSVLEGRPTASTGYAGTSATAAITLNNVMYIRIDDIDMESDTESSKEGQLISYTIGLHETA